MVRSDMQAGEGEQTSRSMPCDLPVESGPTWFARLVAEPGRRRALLAGAAVIVVAVLVVAAIAAVRGCSSARGPVFESAAAGMSVLTANALEVGDEAQAKAVRGEGKVSGTVCIDAGHGGGADLTLTPIGPGSDEMQYVEPGGTAGVVTGTAESQITLAVALLLEDKLEEAGIDVVMVRTTDDVVMSSEERARIANECDADVFLRLHCDGSEDPSVRGFSTLVPGTNEWTAPIVESSAYAAQIMHPVIVSELGANDLGIVERVDLAGFNFCEVPSLLFEMGFMSNPDEDVLLNDAEYQDKLAQALFDATVAYLEAVEE